MSSLGDLYFALGLDDKQFNDALEQAKKKIADLGGGVTIDINIDTDSIGKKIKAEIDKVQGGSNVKIGVDDAAIKDYKRLIEETKKEIEALNSAKVKNPSEISRAETRLSNWERKLSEELSKGQVSTKPVKVDVELNQDTVINVRKQLESLSSPIKTKITVEYDKERFQAATATIKNYTDSLNNLGKIRISIDDSFLKSTGNTNGKGMKGFLDGMSEYLFGDDSEVGKSIGQIQKLLNNYRFKIKTEVDEQLLIKSLNSISKKKIPVGVSLNVNLKDIQKKLNALKIPFTFNTKQAVDDVRSRLKKETFKAKLNLVVDRANISKVIKEAFAKKGLEYAASPSDVRNARILEIQKRMEIAQKKFDRQVKGSVSSTNNLGRSMKNASNWAGQLYNQFNNFISIYSLERFIRNLYTIGGEFQKQQIALQTMIGDIDKGNAIFDRIKDLAVKSPFTFSDLSSYTKQMTAYGIEYENLYDTTKRLADISAGVGVDMGRLILAFGPVRSAAVLRGQELRQFTEAGIPLVAELAKKFTELEGRAVSVGEVFEKISKREVSFDMVKDVLFDMTDPGGKFYEMQEKAAMSLAGKWSNLTDAWDIMIASIANGNNWALSSLADTLYYIINGFKTWLPFVTAAVITLGTLKSAITAVNIVSKTNPWILAATLIAGAISTIVSFVSETESAVEAVNRLNAELEKSLQKNAENESNANRYLDILQEQAEKESDKYKLYLKQSEALKKLIEMYPSLLNGMTLEQLTLEEIAKLRGQITEETKKQNIASYDKNIADLKQQLEEVSSVYYAKETAYQRGERDAFYRIFAPSKETVDNLKADFERVKLLYQLAIEDKKRYEESLKGEETVTRAAWKVAADKIIEKYPNIKLLRKPKEDEDIYQYFDFLEDHFKEAKDKYEKTVSGELRKPQKTIMDALNAVNMGIGGKSFYSTKQTENAAKKAADEKAKADVEAYIEALKNEISKQSQKWDLFKELMDATGDKTLATRIAFNDDIIVDSPYLNDLKEMIKKEADKLGVGISVEELLGMGEKQLANDSRIEEKSREKVSKILGTIINAYNEGNKKLKAETIKDFLDIINSSKDFARQIEDIERNLQKQLDALASVHGKGTPEYNRAANEAIKKAEEEKTKIRFEEFKESSDWVKVFDDLDRVSDDTLDNMTRKIEEFAKQAHLSEEVTKQLVEAMAKLREETIERNPLEGFKDAWNRRKYYQSLKGRVGEYDEDGKLITQKMIDDGLAEANEDLEKSSLAVAKKFQAVADAADLLTGLFENMGVNMDGFLGAISDVIGGAASGAQTGAGIAQAFGAAGPWGAVAGAAVGMLSSVFAMHDKALQKEIEASEAREELIKSLAEDLEESLERQLGGVYKISIDKDTRNILRDFTTRLDNTSWESFWGGEKYYSEQTRKKAHEALSENSYYDSQLAMLMAERDEIEHQMQLEEDKKKTNKEKIADYEQSIKDLNAQIDYFAEDMAKTLYDIDFKDWANQLADSMVNAWATGEDAAEAYKNKVSEILKDLGVSIITQKILEPALEGIMTEFMNYFKANNGKLDQQGIDILAKMYDEADGLAKMTEAYLDGLEKLAEERGESLKGDSSSSSLSKTVQGATENTADLLASYLNGIRVDVSVKRSLIEKLIADDIPQMSVIAQAQLTQLNNIAANTLRNADAADRIYDLFNRVVDKGGNKLKI